MARDPAQLEERAASTSPRTRELIAARTSSRKQQLDDQAAPVGQFEGAVKADQALIDNAKLQLTYAGSPRRSAAASACAWSTSATSCTPPTRPAWW